MSEEPKFLAATEDRRRFLQNCGRFAATVPPAMTILLSTSLSSAAIAKSGGGGGGGAKSDGQPRTGPDGYPRTGPDSPNGLTTPIHDAPSGPQAPDGPGPGPGRD